jgi:hypothetical protein
MKKIITGGNPSGNTRLSFPKGNVCPDQEQRWAQELEASRLKQSQESYVDKSTGEVCFKSGEKADPDLIRKGKIRRFRYDRAEAQVLKYQASDPGVLLKRLYLQDEAEKRARGFTDVLGAALFEKKYPKPVGECSGLEYLVEWSDTRMVSEITVGSQDVFISSTLRGGRAQLGGGARSKITEWSKQSRGRCEKHIRNVEDGAIKAFLTLTYPEHYSNDGKLIKRDLATIIKRLKRMGVKDGIWFLEFQLRGAPHFHCFLSQWPVGGSEAVARAWYEVVGSGDSKHLDWHLGKLSGRPCLEWMRKPHAASYYASKYAVKAEQKQVPTVYQNVGRFWGYWGDLKPVYQTYYSRGSEACSRAVRMIATWKFQKFGGLVDADLVLYSATLRGCSPLELDRLFESSGWCPD